MMDRATFNVCMEALNTNLYTKGIYAEISLNHGVLQCKLYNAKERTTPIDEIYIHESEIHKAVEEVAKNPKYTAFALPNDWLADSLREHLTAPVSLSNINAIRFPLITVKKEEVFIIKEVVEEPAAAEPKPFSIDDIPPGDDDFDIERSLT
ncbi:MAG: hypothetical protein FWC16_04555 [Defluviitaleaceae bacterium]|nr:hypothetical protein [Defluviitaleaceae bacterium]MCL2274179.1 hypothetical protein [Defluviitaleaceae bacterium]